MTTIDERLSEITTTCEFAPEVGNEKICKWCGLKEYQLIHKFKSEIKKLLLDLIAEAKPEGYGDYYASDPIEKGKKMGYNEAINEFENNLIQAINGGKK